jgi:hypothetical protein
MPKAPGRRTAILTTVLWTLTAAAVGVELYSAATDPAATWTESLVRWVPAPLVLAGAAILARWLPGHFTDAYARAGGGRIVGPKAKMWIAIIGGAVSAGLTGSLQLLPDGTARTVLTIVGVVLSTGMTAAGVYQVPNQPAPPAEVA